MDSCLGTEYCPGSLFYFQYHSQTCPLGLESMGPRGYARRSLRHTPRIPNLNVPEPTARVCMGIIYLSRRE